ncbi:hypothetical protein KCV07_g8743, partial [Aureobasidium melanogenum]
MSSDSSTFSSNSKEHPAKRLKQNDTDDYPYRPDVVLLGANREGPKSKRHAFNIVACVHSERFNPHLQNASHHLQQVFASAATPFQQPDLTPSQITKSAITTSSTSLTNQQDRQ